MELDVENCGDFAYKAWIGPWPTAGSEQVRQDVHHILPRGGRAQVVGVVHASDEKVCTTRPTRTACLACVAMSCCGFCTDKLSPHVLDNAVIVLCVLRSAQGVSNWGLHWEQMPSDENASAPSDRTHLPRGFLPVEKEMIASSISPALAVALSKPAVELEYGVALLSQRDGPQAVAVQPMDQLLQVLRSPH